MKKWGFLISILCIIAFIALWVCIFCLGLVAYVFSGDIMTKPVIAVLIILSIAIIASPFYIKYENPKKIIISLIMTVAFAFAGEMTFQGVAKYYSVFTPQKWAENIDMRHRMIESMESQYTLEGMTENEVKSILGEPNHISEISDNNEQHQYCAGGFWVHYYITYENGVVIEAYTVHD